MRDRLDVRDVVAVGVISAACLLVVLPYLVGGPGFYLDDWRNLARLDTVGWLRAAEASKFASRPGAWAVETVLYPTLRSNAVAWTLALVVLNAVAGAALFVLFRRFASRWTALAIVLVWALLPNHTSLKVFANTAPMTVGLILLVLGVILMDDNRVVVGAIVAAAGGMCLEVMLLPGLTALWAFHLLRGRGSRRDAVVGSAVLVATGALMLIHPTYNPATATRGSPAPLLPAHFGSGLTTVPAIAWLLGVVAAIGVAVGVVQFVRGRRASGEGPWLVVAGLAVMAVGLASFALKWPTDVRGQADRNFVVSSVGAAIVWVGVAKILLGRSRLALGAAAVGFAGVLVATNVAFQADWVRSAGETRDLLIAIDCLYDGDPPDGLVVGPEVPVPGNVRAIHQFFLDDAARVTVGRTLDFVLADGTDVWPGTPTDLHVRWEELLSDEACS